MKISSGRGFTLSETLLAAAILLMAILGLLTTFIYCLLLNESNSNLVIAANDAQYALEQIRSLDYGSIGGYSPPAFSNLNNETVTLDRSIGSKIAEVTVNVNWTEKQRQRNFGLTTRIAK